MMAQHYTRNTVRVLKFCEVCGKKTMHTVFDRRIGSCENSHVKVIEKKKVKDGNKSLSLF